MNREISKNSTWLTAAVVSAALTSFASQAYAQADDILGMDDSFLSEPAAVNATSPAKENAPAAPDLTANEPPVIEQNNPFAGLERASEPQAGGANDHPFAAAPMAPANPVEPVLNLGGAPSAPPPMSYAPQNQQQMTLSSSPTEQFLGKLSSDVFREMAEIEQENNTLMLQLKRDKLRSEIDALKTANRQTLFNEIERREKMTQARLEWELEQELKRQAAVERKQQAEIRQKQIEAALKREEERRIQREKEAELARIKQEEEKKEAEKKLLAEQKKKQDALSMIQLNKIKPTLMAVTRPLKPKRVPSEEALQRSSLSDSLLAYKKAGKDPAALADSELNAQGLKIDEEEIVPIKTLYAIKGIHGADGRMIVKLVSLEDEKILYQKEGGELPSGHVITRINKDSIVVKKGKAKEETLPFSVGGYVQSQKQNVPPPAASGAGSINTLGVATR